MKFVSIPESEYEHLLRLGVYVLDWCPNYIACKYCGEYHPIGCICLNCEK